MKLKNIVILGSTGSIGAQTLDVIRHKPESFRVVGLAAYRSVELLAEQVHEFRPAMVAIGDASQAARLRGMIGEQYQLTEGLSGVCTLAALPSTDMVVTAMVGIAGLRPTLAAIAAGKDLALANKETLVTAGALVMRRANDKGIRIIPVDSEHSAIFQALEGQCRSDIKRILLTASGGPFRGWDRERLSGVTLAEALRHPRWNMGQKITVDCSTLANKGLEVIEAKWLFGVEYRQVEVLVHPQSIVHSAVELCDGSVLAQMGPPDMRLPIAYALAYPQRVPLNYPRLNLLDIQNLTFEVPDRLAFPCLDLAYAAGSAGGTMPVVFNAANEVAVELFLREQIRFLEIPELIERVMGCHTVDQCSEPDLEEIEGVDQWARQRAHEIIG